MTPGDDEGSGRGVVHPVTLETDDDMLRFQGGLEVEPDLAEIAYGVVLLLEVCHKERETWQVYRLAEGPGCESSKQ